MSALTKVECILSSPSGAGKTTFKENCKKQKLFISISHTTRQPD